MAARRQAFRQADIARAGKGATAAGMKVGRVEIGQDGRIVLVERGDAAEPATDYDRWKAGRDARQA